MTADIVEFETLEMAEARIRRNCERRADDAHQSFEDRLENKLLLSIIDTDTAEYQRLNTLQQKLSDNPLKMV